ncbi:VanZ like family protein [Haladaptatus litoreus]|uniref:VanZ like family protein n=1 Tax=Haladaptatus litoreus TaxID=553468 RepID=A0A1N6ZSU9_9EURY|nr:VanZ family protein [Haladaptatus litoreus]SIR29930.1 VanZ like family protein [Haladaptatus litoreus]
MSLSLDKPTMRNWAAVLAFAVGICYFSVFSTPDAGVSSFGPLGVVGMDKWYHGIGYGVFSVLLAVALSSGTKEADKATSAIAIALVAIAGATGFGLLMEIAQTFVPVRHGGIGDATANAFGATIGVGLWWLVAGRDEGDLRA